MNSSQNPFSFIPLSKQPLNYWVTMQKTKIDVKKEKQNKTKQNKVANQHVCNCNLGEVTGNFPSSSSSSAKQVLNGKRKLSIL